jgi:hypothetical protein
MRRPSCAKNRAMSSSRAPAGVADVSLRTDLDKSTLAICSTGPHPSPVPRRPSRRGQGMPD